jgi:dCTP deaminase
MLSNIDIQKCLDSGDIVISPWNPTLMRPAGVTLRLGYHILVPKMGKIVDVKTKVIPDYDEVTIGDDTPYILSPKQFILGETYEAIGLSQKVGMLLEGRSTLARLGITVVQTASVIDTGQKPKNMTLEIFNAGVNPVLLYPKMLFCKGIFFLLPTESTLRRDTPDMKYLQGDRNYPIFRDEIVD